MSVSGRWGGRGTEKAPVRDMAQDIALDDQDMVVGGGMDIPGKRNDAPPPWTKPEKKLGLNYGTSKPPPTQERISKNMPVPWKDPTRNNKSGTRTPLPDNDYKASQPSKFMGSMPTPFKPAKTPATRTTQSQPRKANTSSQAVRVPAKEKKAYAAHEAEKAKTMNAFADIRGRIRESVSKAKEEHTRQQNHEEADRDGNVLRGGKAYSKNGTVVEVGDYYTVRGWGKGILRVTRILMRDKRLIAEGVEEFPGHSSHTAWYNVNQLKPYRLAGGTTLRGGKEFMGIET